MLILRRIGNSLLLYLPCSLTMICWMMADIFGISPSFCTRIILLEEDAKPVRQSQRRLNPQLMEVVKKEVTKLLQVGIIYPFLDNTWVSPVHVVPKKFGITVVKNEKDELIPTRIQNNWRVYIDYRRQVTMKDYFPLSFMDQMLDRLVGKFHYCFLNGFSRYFQICITQRINIRPLLLVLSVHMPIGKCHLVFAMFLKHFNDV